MLASKSAASQAATRRTAEPACCLSLRPWHATSIRSVLPKAAPQAAPITQRRCNVTARAIEVEGIDRDYCDDFVCESSPAVEQSVRQFARDLELGRTNKGIYQTDVKFSDGFRGFTGVDKLQRGLWLRENVADVKVAVKRLRMVDRSTAQVSWQATGRVGVAPVELGFTSTIEMNLLTGRILSIKEEMDLSKCMLPVATMVRANKTAWAARQVGMDATESLSSMADSLTSMDEGNNNITPNPNDPTRFFQQQDNTFNDAVMLTAVLAVLYALSKALAEVN